MQQTLFDIDTKTTEDIKNPRPYKGIYSFHKYWGKKPIESIVYFIQQFTNEADIVLDPFLGSGLICRESLLRNRRFIGIDVNPFSIEHAHFLLNLPDFHEYSEAIHRIEINVKNKILSTYKTTNDQVASHYLWEKKILKNVWVKPEKRRSRIELEPSNLDYSQINSFSNYEVKHIRKVTFFNNSRINASDDMTIYDLFTRRALYNIDLIIEEILKYPPHLRRALFLTLTSSSGQMSNMVFAITNRGKTKKQTPGKIEVGSWVIGFWRPDLHFEINVWNCFESRAKRIYKGLKEIQETDFLVHPSVNSLLESTNGSLLINDDCIGILKTLPDDSIKLICTDPPHSDRIPYLELSELWNSILNMNVSFKKEIIVSNARERNKKKSEYQQSMKCFIHEACRVLKKDGLILIYFNSREKQSWDFFNIVDGIENLDYVGSFPLEYSASSVVQDNRKGGMKNDHVLVLCKYNSCKIFKYRLSSIPGWTNSMPPNSIC